MDDGKGARSLKLVLKKESTEMEVKVEKDQTLIDIIRAAGLPLDGILVFNEGRPLPLDSKAFEFKTLTVINVSSGG